METKLIDVIKENMPHLLLLVTTEISNNMQTQISIYNYYYYHYHITVYSNLIT